MSASSPTRRRFLRAVGVVGLGLATDHLLAPRAAASDEVIKVGLLHSLSGFLKLLESPLRDAELLAIAEINKAGGVLGQKVEAVVADTESDLTDGFTAKAKKLLVADKVAFVFGCYVSVARKKVLPVFEQNNGLLFYPVAYEGFEKSKNVVYVGSLPGQQAIPAVDWLLSKAGGEKKKFYLLGSDYVYPRTVNLLVAKHLKGKAARAVAERYVPLGQQEFKEIVRDITAQGADVVLSTLIGDSVQTFFDELAAQGITAKKVPVLSLNVSEDELSVLDPKKVEGHLAAASYFQSVAGERNKEFVKAFRAKYGKKSVTTAAVEAAYAQVYLWKLAVEKAKSTDVGAVRKALAGLEFDAPGGKIKVDAKNQHAWKPFRVGKITKDRQFEVVYEAKTWLAPDPYAGTRD